MIELPVNLAIIGILTAISVSTSMSHKKQAHVTSAKADFKNVHLAVEALAADTEKRPGPSTVGQTADQGIRDLATDDAGLISATNAFTNWKGPYIQSIPQDPWGNNYFFDPDDYIDGNAVPCCWLLRTQWARSKRL